MDKMLHHTRYSVVEHALSIKFHSSWPVGDGGGHKSSSSAGRPACDGAMGRITGTIFPLPAIGVAAFGLCKQSTLFKIVGLYGSTFRVAIMTEVCDFLCSGFFNENPGYSTPI